MGSTFSEIFPPKPKWPVDNIPDLTGKVVIVTGGNTGIGKVACKYLLLKGARVYMLCRSPNKAKEAIEDLKKTTGKEAYFIQCDLADLPSIRRCAEEYMSKETQLHILMNSAGVMTPPFDQITKQGYDMQFGTNTLGHFYLTKQLLPVLLATAKTTRDGKVRVVNTSSNGHHLFSPKGPINYDWMTDTPARKQQANTRIMYGISKLGNVIFAKELAKRYGDQGIVSTSLNPGGIKTDLQRHAGSVLQMLGGLLLHDADPYRALTQLYAATASEAGNMNGAYFYPWARLGKAREDTDDPEVRKKLWDYMEEQTKNI